MMITKKNKAKRFARSERATARNAVALIIVFSLVFTSFSASSYASAAAGEIAWEAFWDVMKSVFTSQTSSFISSAVYEAVDKTVGAYENLQNVIDDANSSIFTLAQVDEPIQFWRSEDGVNYGWQVNTGVNMTYAEQEAAEYMVDWLNSNAPGSEIANQINTDGYLAVQGYEIAKKTAAKAYTSYLESNIKSAGYSFDSGDALASTGSLPTYSFDFVGPKQGITIPTKTGAVSLSKDGYIYSAPISHPTKSGFSKSFVESGGYIGANPADADKNYYNMCLTKSISCYSGSRYVIFDGEIYYNVSFNSTTSSYSRTFIIPNFYNLDGSYNGSMTAFISANGVPLSSVATESNISSFYVGYVYSTEYTGYAYAGAQIDTSDFFTTTAGGDTDFPLSDDEQSISDALGIGLINDDSALTIDENGNITAADGIAIGKLNDIIEMLKNGTLEFEDIQSYLKTISTLVANGNLTAQQQKVLMDNVNTKVADISGDISKINENIASIAKALENDTENLDFEVPSSTIIDKFPFSIPFDFYNIITLLVENPKDPVFYININTDLNSFGIDQKIDESIKLDLTVFKYNGYDIVRIITNATSIILFSLCLISGTKKLIWK